MKQSKKTSQTQLSEQSDEIILSIKWKNRTKKLLQWKNVQKICIDSQIKEQFSLRFNFLSSQSVKGTDSMWIHNFDSQNSENISRLWNDSETDM